MIFRGVGEYKCEDCGNLGYDDYGKARNYIEQHPGANMAEVAKETGVPVILIGHITKEGSIAGPKILEHIVDVVLQFEGDNRGTYRLLRSIKNRFGSTSELAVFEMTGKGLREVSNPSEMLIPMHDEGLSGVAVSAMLDGTRPFSYRGAVACEFCGIWHSAAQRDGF